MKFLERQLQLLVHLVKNLAKGNKARHGMWHCSICATVGVAMLQKAVNDVKKRQKRKE